MADGFADRYEVITKAYDDKGKAIPSRWDGKNAVPPDLKKANLYDFKLDKGLDAKDNLVVFNTTIFKAVFNKGEEGKIYKTGEAWLTVHYPSKWLWFFDYEAKLRVPVAVVRRNAGRKYPDAPKQDETWASTLGFGQQVMTALNDPKYLTGKRIKIAISEKEPSFWLGFFWKHPRSEINLGFIWAQISLVLTVAFYIIGLFGEAYDWAGGLRHFFDHRGK